MAKPTQEHDADLEAPQQPLVDPDASRKAPEAGAEGVVAKLEHMVVDVVNPRLARFAHCGFPLAIGTLVLQIAMLFAVASVAHFGDVERQTVLMEHASAERLVLADPGNEVVCNTFVDGDVVLRQLAKQASLRMVITGGAITATDFDMLETMPVVVDPDDADDESWSLFKPPSSVRSLRNETFEAIIHMYSRLAAMTHEPGDLGWDIRQWPDEVEPSSEHQTMIVHSCNIRGSTSPYLKWRFDGEDGWRNLSMPTESGTGKSSPIALPDGASGRGESRQVNISKLQIQNLDTRDGACIKFISLGAHKITEANSHLWLDPPCDGSDWTSHRPYTCSTNMSLDMQPMYQLTWNSSRLNAWLDKILTHHQSYAMDWPCEIETASVGYRCYSGVHHAADFFCHSPIVSVEKHSRMRWNQAIFDSAAMLNYYEVLATGALLMCYMASRGRSDGLSVDDMVRVATESKTREEMEALHHNE